MASRICFHFCSLIGCAILALCRVRANEYEVLFFDKNLSSVDQFSVYDNESNNLGDKSSLDTNSDLRVFSAGLFHTCAITRHSGVDQDSCGKKECGPVKCWGLNDRGQASPPAGVMFTQISAGGFFSCGLKVDGTVVCWGDIDQTSKLHQRKLTSMAHQQERRLHKSEFKQEIERRKAISKETIGNDSVLVNGGLYIQVSSGMKHACALSRNKMVHCWGRNDFGEGAPPTETFTQISAGNSFTCGLRSSGAIECWGKNDKGQSTPPSHPELIFRQVTASIGGDHACGILAGSNTIRCWGNNGRGQTEIQDGSFLQVAPGIRTTCAIKLDSDSELNEFNTTIHCWGSRANALLDHFVPKDPLRHMRYQQISMGQDHACAIENDSVESAAPKPSSFLHCWWMGGSDFEAHKIPVGLEIIN